MPFPAPVLKLSWGGDVSTDDIWVNNIHLTGEFSNVSAVDAFDAISLSSLKPIIDTAYTGAVGMNPFNNLRWYKLAVLDEQGKYIEDAKYLENTTPIAGTANRPTSPQDSIVVSLRTPANRGLANRGRIYLPSGFAAPQSTNGRISNADRTAVLTKFQTMFNGINTYVANQADNWVVGIASKVRQGQFRFVSYIEVGNIMDNQNRRRNKLSEQYEALPLG